MEFVYRSVRCGQAVAKGMTGRGGILPVHPFFSRNQIVEQTVAKGMTFGIKSRCQQPEHPWEVRDACFTDLFYGFRKRR